MAEAHREKRPENSKEEPKLKRIDLDELGREFEERWSSSRVDRTIIENQDGSRTIYENYEIIISYSSFDRETVETISDFGSTASVLGYRSTIGSLFVPLPPKSNHMDAMMFFFLERIEAPTKPPPNPNKTQV